MYQGSDKNLGKCSPNFFDPVVDLRLKKKQLTPAVLKKHNQFFFVLFVFLWSQLPSRSELWKGKVSDPNTEWVNIVTEARILYRPLDIWHSRTCAEASDPPFLSSWFPIIGLPMDTTYKVVLPAWQALWVQIMLKCVLNNTQTRITQWT